MVFVILGVLRNNSAKEGLLINVFHGAIFPLHFPSHYLHHNPRIEQCRCVAQRTGFAFGYFAQDAAHYFATSGFGQAGHKLDFVGAGNGAYYPVHSL